MHKYMYCSVIGLLMGVLLILSSSEAGMRGQQVLSPFNIIIEGQSPYYQPAQPEVRSGVPVRWFNPTASLHTVTDDRCRRGQSCLFHSGPIGPNQHYTAPDLPPGRYPYHCELHPIMRGVITIIEGQTPQLTNFTHP